jgi:hypothetical protein
MIAIVDTVAHALLRQLDVFIDSSFGRPAALSTTTNPCVLVISREPMCVRSAGWRRRSAACQT